MPRSTERFKKVLQRVVITGIGAVTPLGLTVSELWHGLIDGKSGIGPITLFDCADFDTKIAGEVKGFDPANYMDRKLARRMDRFAQLAVAAAVQAAEAARLKIDPGNACDIGCIIGSGIGGIGTFGEQCQVLFEKGPGRVSPFLTPMIIADMGPGQVSIILGLKGPNFSTVSACSSGSDAIGTATEVIRRGDARAMLAGGSEAAITPIGVAGFNAARALSTRNESPAEASRPFDADRSGFVLSEGSVVMVLESMEWALKRGAPILAEVLSYGATADAYHMTQPADNGEGGARAMQQALKKGGLAPDQINYINAHGTGTPLNDKNETIAIKTVFGPTAYKVPISSTKSMTGHLLGAAGAIEAAVCTLAIQNKIIPPTINLTHPDPECDLDYVPLKARPAPVKIALSNSFGFGGHNSVLILGEFHETRP
ncbi:MAG: beta-ketoacyl-ACP synthase II [Chloroflexi bacterium]|nr:beta-ketoacyl-ACP synthase II [Chloroflexota bacterium]